MGETTLSQLSYYRHSGKYSMGGALAALLLGVLVGLPAAWVYAWLIHWDPLIYINIMCCFGYGALIGYATEQFLVSRKCRNVTVAAVVAFLATLSSYYVSWAVWLHATLPQFSTLEFLKPVNMLGAMLAINEHGTWSLRDDIIRGTVLWANWALEAAAIFGLALYMAVHEMREATFCEGCELWAKEHTGICTVAAGSTPDLSDKKSIASYVKSLKPHAAELKTRLESKDLKHLEQLGPAAPGAIAWYRLDAHSCPQCSMTHTLRVTQFKHKLQGKKVLKETIDKEVLRQLLLTNSEVEVLRKLGTGQAAGTVASAG